MAITPATLSTHAQVRKIVLATVRLSVESTSLGDSDSLYEAGMDSHGSVNLMISLEAQLGIEFPNRLLKRSVFETIDSISSAVGQLLGDTDIRQCCHSQ